MRLCDTGTTCIWICGCGSMRSTIHRYIRKQEFNKNGMDTLTGTHAFIHFF